MFCQREKYLTPLLSRALYNIAATHWNCLIKAIFTSIHNMCLVYIIYLDTSQSEDMPIIIQDPVVRSILSLTSLLVVKMLTVLVSTVSNSQVLFAESLTSLLVVKMLTVLGSTISSSQVFLLKKCELLRFFSAKILDYMLDLLIKIFNDTLTNNIISFGPRTTCCNWFCAIFLLSDNFNVNVLWLKQEFRGRRHRTCWGKSHRSHNQNVVIK